MEAVPFEFSEVARKSFAFLELDYSFRCVSVRRTLVEYESDDVFIDVAWGNDGNIYVRFGQLIPSVSKTSRDVSWVKRLVSRDNGPAKKQRPESIDCYGLAFVAPALFPGELPPEEYARFPEDVLRVVGVQSKFIRDRLSPLLLGDRPTFERVRQYTRKKFRQYSRSIWISQLPQELRSQAAGMDHAQLVQLSENHQRDKLLLHVPTELADQWKQKPFSEVQELVQSWRRKQDDAKDSLKKQRKANR